MLLGSSIPVSLGSVEKQGFGFGVGGGPSGKRVAI